LRHRPSSSPRMFQPAWIAIQAHRVILGDAARFVNRPGTPAVAAAWRTVRFGFNFGQCRLLLRHSGIRGGNIGQGAL
ncbi:MAG: hypothetical protein K8H74_16070, partial [Notoacmeibacter sp.]|nr:hypothetical protein [Notoacmeibacter sp.]